MTIIYPRLNYSFKIGVTAPSSGVPNEISSI